MKANDLIFNFNTCTIDEKIDFFEEYDFNNDIENRDYFISYIKKYSNTKNYFFISILIDKASELGINDNDLFLKYKKFLLNSNHYLIKLSVLDFQLETYSIYYKKNKDLYVDIETLLKRKHERMIVKNQVLLNLMLYNKQKRIVYLNQLLVNLKRTNDYRSHIRIYNTFLNFDYYNFISNDFLEELIKISIKKKLGKSVSDKINEIKNVFNI